KRLGIVLDLEGSEHARQTEIVQALGEAGWGLIFVDVRATGKYAVGGDAIGRAPDHNSAEWSIWTGRPLLGHWIWDVRCTLEQIAKDQPDALASATLLGLGPAGLVALGAAIFDSRVERVALVQSLASLVSDAPYVNQRMGIFAPGLLRDVGDV